MYAAGYGIHPLSSSRRLGARQLARLAAVPLVALAVSVGLAVAAHGGSPAANGAVVVQPGDTIWSIATARYPTDDVRARVDDIERLNGLNGPLIEAGETLRLPA